MLMSLVSMNERRRRRPPDTAAFVACSSPPSKPVAADGTIRFRDGWLDAGFTSVPNVVLRSRRLNPTAKVVYGLLLSYAWEKDHTWPGQDLIASHLDATTRTVRNALTDLKAAHLISVEHRGLRQTNVYWIEPLAAFTSAEQAEQHDCPAPSGGGQRAIGVAAARQVLHFRTDRKRSSDQERQRVAGPERQNPAAESESREQDPREQQPAADVYGQPEAADVVALLIEHGVTRRVAQDLATKHPPDVIRQQVAWHRHRPTGGNPAGALVRAIRDEWAPPLTWAEQKKREAAAARQAEEEAARLAAQEAERREWEALPPEQRVKGRLDFWIIGQRRRGRQPTETEIAEQRAALIAQLTATSRPTGDGSRHAV
jgi:hypothetical protein